MTETARDPEFDPRSIEVGAVIGWDPKIVSTDEILGVVTDVRDIDSSGKLHFALADIVSDEPGEEMLGHPGSFSDGAVRRVDTPTWSVDQIVRGLTNNGWLTAEGETSFRAFLEAGREKGSAKLTLRAIGD